VKKTYLIGVDLGTSGTKAALYRTDGTLVAEAGDRIIEITSAIVGARQPSQVAEIDAVLTARTKQMA